MASTVASPNSDDLAADRREPAPCEPHSNPAPETAEPPGQGSRTTTPVSLSRNVSPLESSTPSIAHKPHRKRQDSWRMPGSCESWHFGVMVAVALLAVAVGAYLSRGTSSAVRDEMGVRVKLPQLEEIIQQRHIAVTKLNGFDFDTSRDKKIMDLMDEPRDVKIIGILGVARKGKTWLFKQLVGRNETGNYIATTGLNLHYDEKNKWLIVDTPGTQATINWQEEDLRPGAKVTIIDLEDNKDLSMYNGKTGTVVERHVETESECKWDGKKVKQIDCDGKNVKWKVKLDLITVAFDHDNLKLEDTKRRDREKRVNDQIQLEKYTQHLVTQVSDVLIFVVSDLTWHEQRSIFEMFYSYIASADSDTTVSDEKFRQSQRRILVAQNMRDIHSAEEAEALFDRQIVDNNLGYKAKAKDNTREKKMRFSANYGDEVTQRAVSYYGFAAAGFEAGKKHNAKNINDIVDTLKNMPAPANKRKISYIFERAMTTLLNQRFTHLEGANCPKEVSVEYRRKNDGSKPGFSIFPESNPDTCTINIIKEKDSVEREYQASHWKELQDGRTVQFFQLPIPGVRKEDIKIKYENGQLTVKYTRRGDPRYKNRIQDQRTAAEGVERTGTYYKQIPIWQNDVDGKPSIDEQALKNGMLRISATKKPGHE